MSAERLKLASDVCRLVHTHLEYADDRKTVGRPEHWRSHADQILATKLYRAKDDCDGYALTAADLLVRKGVPPEDVTLEFCEIRGVGYHLVAGVVVDDCKWIICNNYTTIMRSRHLPYRWDSYMRLSEKGQWRAYE